MRARDLCLRHRQITKPRASHFRRASPASSVRSSEEAEPQAAHLIPEVKIEETDPLEQAARSPAAAPAAAAAPPGSPAFAPSPPSLHQLGHPSAPLLMHPHPRSLTPPALLPPGMLLPPPAASGPAPASAMGPPPSPKSVEESLAKNNLFFFGDVSVANHPDAVPVPMIIPMVYLLPTSSKEPGMLRLSIFSYETYSITVTARNFSF